WEANFPKDKPRREFLDYFFQTPQFRRLRIDPAPILAALPDPLPPARIGEAFAAILRAKAAEYGKVRFGDKTPGHSKHLDRIFPAFAGPRVIHIVRDPRATAESLARMPWGSPSLLANALRLEQERALVEPYRDRVLQIRLEDLLADARATLGRVLDF